MPKRRVGSEIKDQAGIVVRQYSTASAHPPWKIKRVLKKAGKVQAWQPQNRRRSWKLEIEIQKFGEAGWSWWTQQRQDQSAAQEKQGTAQCVLNQASRIEKGDAGCISVQIRCPSYPKKHSIGIAAFGRTGQGSQCDRRRSERFTV